MGGRTINTHKANTHTYKVGKNKLVVVIIWRFDMRTMEVSCNMRQSVSIVNNLVTFDPTRFGNFWLVNVDQLPRFKSEHSIIEFWVHQSCFHISLKKTIKQSHTINFTTVAFENFIKIVNIILELLNGTLVYQFQ